MEKHTRDQKSNGKRCSSLPDIYTPIDKTLERVFEGASLIKMSDQDLVFSREKEILSMSSLGFLKNQKR